MRICRFRSQGTEQVGLYDEEYVVPLKAAAAAMKTAGDSINLPDSVNLLDYLPPSGPGLAATKRLSDWATQNAAKLPADARLPTKSVELLVPIPRPNKIFLLAGNYVDHIKEGGGMATERQETFPYVFMKPPTTTLTDPGKPIRIPKVSPKHVDWELELAVVIGKRAKHVKESDALSIVAGFTIINDISDRKFQPNPQRKKREK